MNYKELIISLLGKINDERFLKAIYISVRDYVKESEVRHEKDIYKEKNYPHIGKYW